MRTKKNNEPPLYVFGAEYSHQMVYFTLCLLPKPVAYFAAEKYSFICTVKELDGSRWTFDKPFLKGKAGFILLAEHLWKKSKTEIAYIIAHEIAHAWEKHDDPEVDLNNQKEVANWKKGYIKREKEADALAVKWLSKHLSHKSLLKLSGKHQKIVKKRML